jgi:hypothetical protein
MAEPTPTPTPTPTPVGDDGGKKFTQEELNAIIADRLTRQKQQFADYDALKTKAGQWDTYEQTQKTEQQKTQERIQQLEQEAARATQNAKDTMIRAAIEVEAGKQGVAFPGDVIALADMSKVTFDAVTGKVTGAEDAVKTVVSAGRVPLRQPQAPKLDGGAGTGNRPGGTPPPLTPEEISIAQKLGIKPEAYAAQKAAISGTTQQGGTTWLQRGSSSPT